MKPLKILLSVLAFVTSGISSPGQGFVLTYSGVVQDISSLEPVPYHPVDIFANDQIYLKTILTDETGTFRDTLFPFGDTLLNTLRFATLDCMQQTVDTSVNSFNELIFVTLRICVDSIPVPCQADFEAVLDSNLNILSHYQFIDRSTGSIDAWMWDFGDGTFSIEQHPVHQYLQQGTYEVCLTVTSLANPAGCTDTDCQLVTTPSYYNFGGMTYLGETPMNNPVNEGDTGLAYLYRLFEQQLIPVDMKSFVDYGYFWFTGMLEGEYVVKISLSPGSTHYADYFPAYSGGSILWESASIFDLNDSTFFDANIHLQPVPDMPSGTGTISGFLVTAWDDSTRVLFSPEPVVLLCDDTGNPLQFRHPGEDGTFMFTGLPAGNYLLRADVTGYLTQAVSVSLTPGGMVLQGIELMITAEGTFGIADPGDPVIFGISLYPNPATDVLHADFYSPEDDLLRFVAFDLLGRNYPLDQISVIMGRNTVSLNVQDLPRGMYLLGAMKRNGTFASAGKFIR